MNGILNYSEGNTFLHRLNPVIKLLLAFLICIACFSADNIFVLIGFILLDLAIGAVGKIFCGTVKLFAGLLKISVFLFVVQILFVQRGTVLIPLALGLNITSDGIRLAITVVLRLIGATLPLTTLITLTKMTDLSNALCVNLHLPYKYAFALTTAIHFIPVFSSDMKEIIEAQTARGVEFDTRNLFRKIGLVLPLCVPLLVSSVKKIENAAIAAELRGFNLRTRKSTSKKPCFGFSDALTVLAGAALTTVGIVF